MRLLETAVASRVEAAGKKGTDLRLCRRHIQADPQAESQTTHKDQQAPTPDAGRAAGPGVGADWSGRPGHRGRTGLVRPTWSPRPNRMGAA